MQRCVACTLHLAWTPTPSSRKPSFPPRKSPQRWQRPITGNIGKAPFSYLAIGHRGKASLARFAASELLREKRTLTPIIPLKPNEPHPFDGLVCFQLGVCLLVILVGDKEQDAADDVNEDQGAYTKGGGVGLGAL